MALYECLDCGNEGEFLYRKGRELACLKCDSPNITAWQYGRDARNFDPILIHQSLSDPNDYSFPGHNADPTPEGYRPITITNMRAADRIVSRINSIEAEKVNDQRTLHRMHFDERKKQTRENILSKISHNPKAMALFRATKAYSDAKRDKKYAGRIDPNFHIQALSFDSSNRQPFADIRTGWKDRRS